MRRVATAVALAALLLCAAAALAAPGDLDQSFDGDGIRTIEFGSDDAATDVLTQGGGKLVVAGHSGVSTPSFAVARLNLDGTLDQGFGVDGKATIPVGGRGYVEGVAVQPDGMLVLAGYWYPDSSDFNPVVVRLTGSGALDRTFDGDGQRKLDYGGRDQATDVLVQPDGKIVLAGTIYGSEFLVARLNPNGSLDPGFVSSGGTASIDFEVGAPPSYGQDLANAVARQPDGKLVVAGLSVISGSNTDVAVARLNANGSLDSSFDGDGRKTLDWGGSDAARDVLVQPDGKIVLVGYSPSGTTVTRLNADGSLDDSFNGTGTTRADDVPFPEAAALQANGKLVVTGLGSGQAALLRFQPGGARDTTFGSNGKRILPVAGSASAVTLLSDGRIAVAGGSTDGTGPAPLDFLVGLVVGDSPAAGGGPGAGPGGGGGGGAGGGGGTFKVARCGGRKATIVGTNRSERLKGTRRADVIVALGGNDGIDGGRGNDLVCAGDGDDNLKGAIGNDRLYGQNGKDKLAGGSGKDRLSGGNGNDRLDGGTAGDNLSGQAGKDELTGGSGKDGLSGGNGRDTCDGGAGTDRARCERRRAI